LPKESLRDSLLFSTAYYDRAGNLMRLTLSADDKFRLWTPIENFAPELVETTLLREDRYFFYHPGFNVFSLFRGAWVTFTGGSRQGGSTITMQLARLRYKLHTRAITGKLRQIAAAVYLEARYSKREILEGYLNYAPYGRNIEGAGAAALIYFGKESAKLTLLEAATLAVLPQSPTLRVDKNAVILGENLAAARNDLLNEYAKNHEISDTEKAIFAHDFKIRRIEELPFSTPHLTNMIAAENYRAAKNPMRVDTAIDPRLQELLERQIKLHIEKSAIYGVKNGAAILVDTRDMSLVAAVGSANFFEAAIEGQVNGFTAKRSPGSALKPFIYALAVEQGLIHPETVLKDLPSAFGSYEPENFDGGFTGPISARKALVASRNVPAVYLANALKDRSFYAFLRQAGVAKMASESHYGLALALGGFEVTMLETAKLYAALANGGILREIRYEKSQPIAEGKEILSREAAFIALEMLASAPHTDRIAAESSALPIYWKTGTSRGSRDAWCAGLAGHYALVVWLGNFDNSPNPALIGVEQAAPLFFTIARSLAAGEKLADPNRAAPNGVKEVEVCLTSGDLATAWCKRRAKSWFIPGVSPIKVDNVYRPVRVDKKTRKPLCEAAGFDPKNAEIEVFEFYSSDILALFRRAGLPKREPPDLSRCDLAIATFGAAPEITSPLKNARYAFRRSRPDERRIILSATLDSSSQAIYWFAGGEYLGRAARGEVIAWRPRAAGAYNLTAIDDHNRAASRNITIGIVD
jgi:penicillin-binding protein 1C